MTTENDETPAPTLTDEQFAKLLTTVADTVREELRESGIVSRVARIERITGIGNGSES